MTTADVARRLGFILSPVQERYRQLRRDGVDRPRARQLARDGAAQLGAIQTAIVMRFIARNAVWHIPDDRWPPR